MKNTTAFHKLWPVAAGILGLASNSFGQFTYHDQDVMAVFRQTGSPDLEVNMGPASFFYNLATTSPGSTVSISSYSPVQFGTAFSSAVGVNWAVMSAVPLGGGTTQHPARTAWLTAPRVSLGTQTSPYQGDSGSTQGSWVSVIRGIAGAGGVAGAVPWGTGTPPSPLTNSASVAIIPTSDPSSATLIEGTQGDLGGTFGQGSIENGSGSAFTIQRSDFYEIHPSGGDATYLGYFDFDANGGLSFTAVPEPNTMGLIGIGGIFLLSAMRRRNARCERAAPNGDSCPRVQKATLGGVMIQDSPVLIPLPSPQRRGNVRLRPVSLTSPKRCPLLKTARGNSITRF